MADALCCFRCGESLAALSLPLARLDECPACRAQLHVCRMCTHYAPRLTDGCDEDDAPDVRDKSSANFCDYFRPNPAAHVAADRSAETAAKARLDALFDAAPSSVEPHSTPGSADAVGPRGADGTTDDEARRAAEALFKK